MRVLLYGLFVALVLLLELVGVVVLGRSTLSTETYLQAGGSAATMYIGTFDDDGGAYWVEWEDPSCGVWGIPAESDIENFFEVDSSESEIVGTVEVAGCRGHLRPHAAPTRRPGVWPSGGHRAEPTFQHTSSSRYSGE
jgi:hypothetical protein